MKKAISLFIVILLCLGMTGCNSKVSEETEEIIDTEDIEEVNPGYEVVSRYGVDVYNMDGFEIPVALGFPKVDQESVSTLFDLELQNHITNYADLVMYLKNKTFYEGDDLVSTYVKLMARFYDEAGTIAALYGNSSYNLMYLKKDDIYYPIDINAQFTGDGSWMEGYNADFLCADNKKDLCINIKESRPDKEDIFIVKTTPSTKEEKYNPVYTDNGIPVILSSQSGVEMIVWDNCNIPSGFGFPEYTKDEIRQMVNDPDKTQVAEKIHTVADAVAYYRTARFMVEEEDKDQRVGHAHVLDVGNVIYDDTPFAWYGVGGLEQLPLKRGQCSGSSTLFNYLLWGDYDDLGYITIPGHCFMYIKGHDDKYYLFEPSDYLRWPNQTEVLVKNYMHNYDGTLFADSLEELMDNLIEAEYLGNTTSIFTLSYDGVMAYQMDTSQNVFDPMCKRLFPLGSIAHCWLGDIEFDYIEFEHPTSQEHIIGIK